MSATPNRLSTGRPGDLVKTKMADMMLDRSGLAGSRPFHLAQVIDSNDPKKANRLRLRIPIIDDVFYLGENGKMKESEGDEKLPWAVGSNGRFIDTPENGSVVLVLLLDPEKPHTGRVWLSVLNELTTTEIFDVERLKEEMIGTDAWKNAEDNLGVKYNNSPGLRDKPTMKSKSKTTNYKVGVRGKKKNKLLFEETKTTLIQNEGQDKESKLELTENVLMMAKELSFLSSQSQQEFHPVFDTPMYNFLTLQLSLIQAIITILTTMPGLALGYLPVSPNPGASALNTLYQQVNQNLTNMKQPGKGASKYIKIN